MKWVVVALILAAVLGGLGYEASLRSTMNVLGRPVPVDGEVMASFEKAFGRGGIYSLGSDGSLPALRKKHRAYKAKITYYWLAGLAALAGISLLIYPKLRRAGIGSAGTD